MTVEHPHTSFGFARLARVCLEDRGGLVNVEGLARRWGVSKSTAWTHTRSPGFPEPVTYEGRSGPVKLWFAGEADAYRRDGHSYKDRPRG